MGEEVEEAAERHEVEEDESGREGKNAPPARAERQAESCDGVKQDVAGEDRPV